MAYKDKDKQREAGKERARRYRVEQKALLNEGVTPKAEGVTKCESNVGVTDISPVGALHQLIGKRNEGVTDKLVDAMLSGDVASADKCADEILGKPERTAQGNIRVSKPGDDDYVPQCETTRAFIEGRDKRPETGKRGKDIKCFEDLPHAAARRYTVAQQVQQAINGQRQAEVGYGSPTSADNEAGLNKVDDPHDGGVGFNHSLPRTVN